jgi:hypothetical protein
MARVRPKVEVVWEAPPEPLVVNQYRDALQEVKTSPGRWARLRISETQSPAYGARKSILKIAPEPEWEIRVQKVAAANGQPERWGVWVRFRTEEQMRAMKR